jgi:hypothetical protein
MRDEVNFRMATVNDLEPGDKVTLPGGEISGVFIARQAHPHYQGLMLVVWRLSDRSMSYDALRGEQEVGEVERSTDREKGRRLLNAMKEIGRL